MEPYRTLLAPIWSAARNGAFSVISSELLLIETLVGPIKAGKSALEGPFRAALFKSSEFELVQVNLAVLELGAQLPASYGSKTPVAIHAATSMMEGRTLFITNDSPIV